MIVKTLARVLAPGGPRGRLSILIFHRVLAHPDSVMRCDPDAAQFELIIGWLKQWFNVLPLDEAVARLNAHSLPPRAAAITFDDGYADNYAVAMPILQRHGLSATFFVATGYLDGGRMWNDTLVEAVRQCGNRRLDLSDEGLGTHDLNSDEAVRQAIDAVLKLVKYRDPEERIKAATYVAKVSGARLPTDLMMTSEQVKKMRRAGMTIGAHTVTHPILARLSPDDARAEVAESKQFLESLLQERVGLFAYPNGKPDVDYRAVDADMIRGLGFDAAVTTAWGVADARSDLTQLPRFTPWDRTRFRFGTRLARNLLQNRWLRSGQLAS